MKIILKILGLILLWHSNLCAQNEVNPKVGDTITLKSWCTVVSHRLANTNQTVPLPDKWVGMLAPNVKFIVNKIDDTTVELAALDFMKLSDEVLQAKQSGRPGYFDKADYYNGKLYTISREEFDASATKPKEDHILSGGLISLPFKARPQEDLTFDTEFNINTTLNVRLFKINSSSFNIQAGAGIGTVSLNSAVAKGIEGDEAQDVAVLSFLGGCMIQYKKLQAGLYVGVDHINNQAKYQWESNGNLWFGFGVGISLYKISLGGSSNKQE